MKILNLRTVLMTTVMSSMLSVAPAVAQTDPTSADTAASAPEETTEVGAIVVTGIRQSLQAGLDTKRQSATFVDSIVAADIGKLPDLSIADSLQRVSGVQIRRALGTGSSVSIRGLRQNRTEVNGRTLISPYGRGPGPLADADYTALSLYPSEIISRLEVTKLLTADQPEGSLGGTVNIVTRRPLDSSKSLYAASVEGSHSDLTKREGFRASALVSHNFADNRLGVLVNVAYSDQPVQEDSFNSFAGWLPLAAAAAVPPAASTSDPNGDGIQGIYIADLRFQRLADRRKRFSVNGVVQYAPTDELILTLDTLYTKGTSKRDRSWFAAALSSDSTRYTNPVFSANEALIAGTITTPFQGNDEFNDQTDYGFNGALIAAYESGPFKLSGEFNYSEAELDYTQTYVRTQSIASYPIGFDFRGTVPTLTLPTGIDILDPALIRYSNFFDNRFPSRSTEVAGRVDGRYDLDGGFFDAVQIGARYARLSTFRDTFQTQLTSNVTLPSRSSSLYEIANFPGLLGGAAPFAEQYIVGNPFGTGEPFACLAINPPCTPENFNPIASFTIRETTKAAYARVDYATTLGDIGMSGNFGLRYARTERLVTGAITTLTTPLPVTSTPSYSDWLPSFVAKFDVSDTIVVRAGAAKVVGSPDTQNMTPGLTVNRIVSPATATGGNPSLQPFRADQYDLSAEWYFRPGAAITAGLFYKKISSFLSNQTAFETLPGDTAQSLVTRTANGTGGSLKGVELLVQLPFYFLPAPLDGFGVLANYSYIDSKTPFRNRRTNAELPLEGLSKHNLNLIGYYERGGFGIRGAYNYRSEFLDGITAGGEGTFFEPYDTVDASVRYDFGMFQISAEAANLTNAKQIRYTGTQEAIALYAEQGRRYSIGASVRF